MKQQTLAMAMKRPISNVTRSHVPSRPSVLVRSCVIADSGGVMKDDSERMAMARAQLADAMAQFDVIGTARALHRPAVDREHHCIALRQRHHRRARLHARALLGQDELAAVEILAWRAEQNRHLQRKYMFAV